VRRQRDRDLEGKDLSGGVMGGREVESINRSRPTSKEAEQWYYTSYQLGACTDIRLFVVPSSCGRWISRQ
jgi:hypothetical protein